MSKEHPQDPEYQRQRALKALRIYFAHRRWPRLMMSGIMLCTWAVGFLASYVLLHCHIYRMWVRYPLSVLVAWVAFLFFTRLWAEFERTYFSEAEDISRLLEGRDPVEVRQRVKERDWSFLDWLDLSDLDLDPEGCLGVIAFILLGALIIAALGAIITIITAAPMLISEIFLDAILVSALYKRVRSLDQRWWISGAVRQTAKPVLLSALLLLIVGVVFHYYAPEARSIGGVWLHWRNPELKLEK